jgi:hypothetical protein
MYHLAVFHAGEAVDRTLTRRAFKEPLIKSFSRMSIVNNHRHQHETDQL